MHHPEFLLNIVLFLSLLVPQLSASSTTSSALTDPHQQWKDSTNRQRMWLKVDDTMIHRHLSKRETKKGKGSKKAKGNKKLCTSTGKSSKYQKKSKKSKSRPTTSEGFCPSASLTEVAFNTTSEVKNNIFGNLQFAKAVSAEYASLLSFQTTEFLWFAWEVLDEKVPLLQDSLPSGFQVSKIAISHGEEPKFYIVLNLYNVIITGNPSIRAEWSTFVITTTIDSEADTDTPYFMIIDAPTNAAGIEPTQCLPKDPIPLTYDVENSQVVALLEAQGGSFASNFSIPCLLEENRFALSPEFQQASEKNYWLSGVYDKGLYSASLPVTSPIIRIPVDNQDFSLTDNTYWSTLYKSDLPDHVFYYTNPIDFVLDPWYNLEEVRDKIDEDLYVCLNEFKFNPQFGFAGLSFLNALGVLGGTDEALLNHKTLGGNGGVPVTYLNFQIKESYIEDIENLLPNNFELVKTKTRENDEEIRYTMTLRIREGGIVPSFYFGLQAELVVYVRCKNTQEVYQMILETKSNYEQVQADRLSVDPVSSFTYAKIEQETRSSNTTAVLQAHVEDTDFSFTATIPYISTNVATDNSVDPSILDLTWLASHDRQYVSNGIYDYYICDSQLYNMKAITIDPKEVENFVLESRWFEFVDQRPFEVLLVHQDVECIVRPWYNLNDAIIVD